MPLLWELLLKPLSLELDVFDLPCIHAYKVKALQIRKYSGFAQDKVP